jgi:aspartate 1-decarboxylase
MLRTFLRSKIHRATVTEANLDYEGSITLDPVLMAAAGLAPYELVHVLDLNSGARFETYAIEGRRGSGTVCVNGAAARLVQKGDQVIILSYIQSTGAPAPGYRPAIVHVDARNKVVKVRGAERRK